MAIARKDATNRSQYMLTLALSFGMVDDLRLATLNRSTTADQQPSMSPSGHPIILLDCTFNPVPEVPGGLLGILLQAEPAVIRLTGNTRKVLTDTGTPKLLPEVEILMGEDDLAHTCCYCGKVEFIEPWRFRCCSSDPATPQYICSDVCVLWSGSCGVSYIDLALGSATSRQYSGARYDGH